MKEYNKVIWEYNYMGRNYEIHRTDKGIRCEMPDGRVLRRSDGDIEELLHDIEHYVFDLNEKRLKVFHKFADMFKERLKIGETHIFSWTISVPTEENEFPYNLPHEDYCRVTRISENEFAIWKENKEEKTIVKY